MFSVIALGIGTPGLVNQGVLIASLSDTDQRERSQQQLVNDVRPMLEGIAGHHRLPDQPVDDQRLRRFARAVRDRGRRPARARGLGRRDQEPHRRLRRLRQRADQPVPEQAAARGLDRPRPRQRPRRLGALDRERPPDPARRARPLDLQARGRDLRRDGAARAARSATIRATCSSSTCAATTTS